MSRHSWMAAGAAMTVVLAAQKERKKDGSHIVMIQQVLSDNRVPWVSPGAGVKVWVKFEGEGDGRATIRGLGWAPLDEAAPLRNFTTEFIAEPRALVQASSVLWQQCIMTQSPRCPSPRRTHTQRNLACSSNCCDSLPM